MSPTCSPGCAANSRLARQKTRRLPRPTLLADSDGCLERATRQLETLLWRFSSLENSLRSDGFALLRGRFGFRLFQRRHGINPDPAESAEHVDGCGNPERDQPIVAGEVENVADHDWRHTTGDVTCHVHAPGKCAG